MKKNFLIYFAVLVCIVFVQSCGPRVVKKYYSNGQIQLEYQQQENNIHGYWKAYDSLGKLIEERYYNTGLLEGELKRYYLNGSLREVTWYAGGKRDGPYKKFYQNGKISESGNFKEDLLNGEGNTYDSLGRIVTSEFTCMGVYCGTYTEYYPDGRIHTKTTYGSSGVAEGPYQLFHPNGKLKEEGTYKNGELDGEVKQYDSLGVLSKVIKAVAKKDRPA